MEFRMPERDQVSGYENQADAGVTRLLVSCADRCGVVASVTAAVSTSGGNILDVDQHADPMTGSFSMRVAFEGMADRAGLESALGGMDVSYQIRAASPWARMAILCSKQTHCVADLLWRASIGELPAKVTRVISNHDDASHLARTFGYDYEMLPVTKETKAAQEGQIVGLLEDDGVDLVVLARYMQVLSAGFVEKYAGRIINIHHSFLPAFAGGRPYHRAFERGVKLIGATAHYVTADLDEGPIIAQRTAHVTHRDGVEDMIRKGRDLERVVLAEAVRMHLEDRVLIDGGRTVVFE
jgi:formyltetrahydrofolate deformylase